MLALLDEEIQELHEKGLYALQDGLTLEERIIKRLSKEGVRKIELPYCEKNSRDAFFLLIYPFLKIMGVTIKRGRMKDFEPLGLPHHPFITLPELKLAVYWETKSVALKDLTDIVEIDPLSFYTWGNWTKTTRLQEREYGETLYDEETGYSLLFLNNMYSPPINSAFFFRKVIETNINTYIRKFSLDTEDGVPFTEITKNNLPEPALDTILSFMNIAKATKEKMLQNIYTYKKLREDGELGELHIDGDNKEEILKRYENNKKSQQKQFTAQETDKISALKKSKKDGVFGKALGGRKE